MSDSSSGGNRWEPGPTAPLYAPPTAEIPQQPMSWSTATVVADRPTYPVDPAPVTPKRGLRDRIPSIPRTFLIAAVSAFLLVIVGFGGFAVGRATALNPGIGGPGASQGGATQGDTSQQGVPDQGDTSQQGVPDGFPGFDSDGDGQPDFPDGFEGTVPDQGTDSGNLSS